MSTPSPPEPRPPEKLPASSPDDSAMADGGSAGAVNDKLPGAEPISISAHSTFRGGSASRAWSDYPTLRESDLRQRPRRRVLLPLVLFAATCVSTFWVGAANWRPQSVELSAESIQARIATHW